MFGLLTRRQARKLADFAVDQALRDVMRGVEPMIEGIGREVQAERQALQARAEAAEGRCKALQRRLDGWVPADQASSMRWRIRELEAQVGDQADDAQIVAFFSPGRPVLLQGPLDRDTVAA